MNVIITKSFEKDGIKIFWSVKNWEQFCIQFKKTQKISLKSPFKKFKFSLQGISVRGIYVMTKKQQYIPIFIVKKSDKKYGMNLIITSEILPILENKYRKSLEDIENGEFAII